MILIPQFRVLQDRAVAFAFLCFLCGISPAVLADELPDVALFFAQPAVSMARISPEGDYVALVRQVDKGRFEVLVSPTADPTKAVSVARSDVADVIDVHWVNDQRLLVRTGDLHGDHEFAGLQGGLFAVDRDGSDSQFLITGDWGYNQEQTGSYVKSHLLPAKFVLLAMVEDGSDDIIVGEREFTGVDRHLHHVSPYRLDTRSRALTSLIDTTTLPAAAQSWVFDADARPRLFINREDGRRQLYYRDEKGGQWEMLGNFEDASGEGFVPQFFGYDGTLYVALGNGGEASALYRYDFAHHQVEDQPLVRIKGFDFAGSAEMDPHARKILGFHFNATYGMPRLVGDRARDANQLRETSPLANAARLGQPLLMAYGGRDRRVPIVHGTKFRDAVSATNHQVEWLDYPNEGHGWYIDEDNVDFWTHVEKFLHVHLASQP